ncbi:MAG TPA: ABC transporter substrate-binding protein [Chloroflexota bacterium]|nr:ABC transporter substrate-binding protein [Chloroflexota bacterium]
MSQGGRRGARRAPGGWARAALLVGLVVGLTVGCAAPAAAPAGPARPGAAAQAPPTSLATPSASGPSAPATAPAGSPQAAGGGTAAPGPLATPIKVRMGSVGSLVDGPLYVALDRGYFADVGLDVEDIRAQGATELVAPLAAGQIDVLGAAMAAGLYNAFARNIDVRIVADKGRLLKGHGNAGLVARQDLWDSNTVRTLPDLRGRRVGLAGYNAGSAVTLFLGHALDAQGMSIADVEPVDIVLGDLNVALANRSLDAAIQVEPGLTLGVANGLYSIIARSDELYPDLQSGFVLYSASFVGSGNDAARRWMVGYLRGVRDYVDAFDRNRGRDDVIAILARTTGVKDVSLYDKMVSASMDPNGRLNVPALVDAQDWFAAHGYIPQKVDVPALIDYQFVDYAVGVLGEYR